MFWYCLIVCHTANDIQYECLFIKANQVIMPTCLAFPVVVFYCFMSFMKTSIVFEGLSIILYLFWYLQMWVLNQAAADLVLIMYLTNSIPEWHIIWIFVYLRRHMFWGPLVYLFRVVSFVYVTFINASIVFVWLDIISLFCFEMLLNQKLKIWRGRCWLERGVRNIEKK